MLSSFCICSIKTFLLNIYMRMVPSGEGDEARSSNHLGSGGRVAEGPGLGLLTHLS